MAYSSLEFGPVAHGQPNMPFTTATCFNDQIWLIGSGSNEQLWQVVFTVPGPSNGTSSIEQGAAKNQANWAATAISMPGMKPTTFARPAVVVSGASLYLFWNQSVAVEAEGFYASAYGSTGTSAPSWSRPVQLVDVAGIPLQESLVDIAATAWGNTTIFVSIALPNAIFLGAYDTSQGLNVDTGVWKPLASYLLPVSYFKTFPGLTNLTSLGERVSMDWFQIAVTDSASPPSTFLGIDFLPTAGQSKAAWHWYVPFDQDGNLQVSASTAAQTSINGVPTIKRDPAGRLVDIQTDPSAKQLSFVVFSTYGPKTVNSSGTVESLSIVLGAVPTFAAPHANEIAPTVTYLVDTSAAEPTSLPNGASDVSGTQYPVYQFVFYGENQCQVQRYGTAQVIPNWGTRNILTTQPGYPSQLDVVQGQIDGPIPLPNENIVNATFPPGETFFGTISFGNTTGATHEHSVSWAWTLGFEFSGKTTKGEGIAWDTALKGGLGSTVSSTTGTTEATDKPYSAQMTSQGAQQVTTTGRLFCADPSVLITVYRFLDPNGNAIVDPTTSSPPSQGPVLVTVQTLLVDNPSTELYQTYGVAPGNLWSYTPQAWNARMSKLAAENPSTMLYSGSNYFGDVIEANAYQFPGEGGETVPYLTVPWAPGSTPPYTFNGTSESFVERSWTLDAKVYLGISGGEEVSCFGFGEGFEFSFLAGLETQDQGNTQVTTSEEWGIQLSEPWGPPSPDSAEPPGLGVNGYTFRIYFLPVPASSSSLPPNYWTTELRQYLGQGAGDQIALDFQATSQTIPVTITYPTAGSSGVTDPQMIDPNSGFWRIVFVVTRIELVDGTVWQYDDSLDHHG